MPNRHFVLSLDASLVAEVDHCDDSALRAAGWRPPENFTVKAADGVTDLLGTIYRPSDFDPAKQYPILTRSTQAR